MEKINIAELLKNCPKGMELDCVLSEDVILDDIDISSNYPIKIIMGGKQIEYLSPEGCLSSVHYANYKKAKCVIFPKGKNTWKEFVPPCKFKDGDVCYVKTENFEHIFIFKVSEDCDYIQKYINLSENNFYIDESPVYTTDCVKEIRLATEKEKQKLFNVIKVNGYKWNTETKTLEKLVEPKFKVGDKVQLKKDIREKRIIDNVLNNCYTVQGYGVILFTAQDEWELAPNKFDITTLKAFESRVLVRSSDGDIWRPAIYGVIDSKKHHHYVVGGNYWTQCIPFEHNEHLLGTTNDCDEYYKN